MLTSFAKQRLIEYIVMAMNQDIVLAATGGLAFSALQLFLMCRVLLVWSGWLRATLLFLKLPLWALALGGIAFWWGTGPLIAFAMSAGVAYLVASVAYFAKSRKGE